LSVRVTGGVFSAGRYYLAPTSTILDALTEAGGMTPELTGPGVANIPTDQSRVRLVRDGESHVLNLRPDEATDAVLNMPIRSGDWIHVPNQARSRVRDELQFWGGVISFVANLVAIIIFVGN
jgi:protein involved in polysaccharide export with SLBB domain